MTATADELRNFLSAKFAKWQLPDAFIFLDELPHTSTGNSPSWNCGTLADWQWDAMEERPFRARKRVNSKFFVLQRWCQGSRF